MQVGVPQHAPSQSWLDVVTGAAHARICRRRRESKPSTAKCFGVGAGVLRRVPNLLVDLQDMPVHAIARHAKARPFLLTPHVALQKYPDEPRGGDSAGAPQRRPPNELVDHMLAHPLQEGQPQNAPRQGRQGHGADDGRPRVVPPLQDCAGQGKERDQCERYTQRNNLAARQLFACA